MFDFTVYFYFQRPHIADHVPVRKYLVRNFENETRAIVTISNVYRLKKTHGRNIALFSKDFYIFM